MNSNLRVSLLRYTPNADELIASAAKLCYSPVGVSEIMENLTQETIDKFLNMLTSIGHGSPFEHASFTFAVEGVSRITEQQLTRHRMASYSIQSGRYVKRKNAEFVVPPNIANNEEAKNLYLKAMEEDQKYYDELVGILQDEHFEKSVNKFIESNDEVNCKEDISVSILDKMWKNAEKLAIEDSRYVFPQSLATKIVFTMNARELMHFFGHRCCDRSQWEIRLMATEMLRQVKQVSPSIFKHSGPSCVYGACKEGNMTCGKALEVRKTFKEL